VSLVQPETGYARLGRDRVASPVRFVYNLKVDGECQLDAPLTDPRSKASRGRAVAPIPRNGAFR
jgi:hypothetical protein